MICIELTPDEATILQETLEERLSDLSMEISHTDQQDYRNMLKTRRAALDRVLAALEPRSAQDAPSPLPPGARAG